MKTCTECKKPITTGSLTQQAQSHTRGCRSINIPVKVIFSSEKGCYDFTGWTGTIAFVDAQKLWVSFGDDNSLHPFTEHDLIKQ